MKTHLTKFVAGGGAAKAVLRGELKHWMYILEMNKDLHPTLSSYLRSLKRKSKLNTKYAE